ncbi:effector-associated constant component EACC1 [Streptomyces sp. YGL11-2]|uniref:effector-associated constant component EACC1 n=1 Tax=Streptomyces sp. YGL11-2 TaxID=3414028 RepID=UPI003CF25D0D
MAYRESQLLWIRTDNGADELRSLLAWLQGDDALRGRVRLEHAPISSDEMGGLVDALTVALGYGGIGVALSRSLSTWISQRRSDIKVKVTARNGQSIEVDAKRVDAQALMREIERISHTEEGA